MTKYVQPQIEKKIFTKDYSDFFDYLTEYIDESKKASPHDSYGGLWLVDLNETDYDRAFEVVIELRFKVKNPIIWNGGFEIEEKEAGDEKDSFKLTYMKNEIEVTLNKKKTSRTLKK